MLYDPKWEKQTETKADPYSLASLVAWLETKPPAEDYDIFTPAVCLLGQFARAMGHRDPGEWSYRAGGQPVFRDVAFGRRSDERQWNFAGALHRAREALNAEKSLITSRDGVANSKG